MRVIEFNQFSDPSELHLAERPDLKATESTAIVQVIAASVNPSDVKNVAGRMPQTTLPRVPGRDYSGVVVDWACGMDRERGMGHGWRCGLYAGRLLLVAAGERSASQAGKELLNLGVGQSCAFDAR